MAQLAIPLLALGGLYVIAKQSEEDSELDSKEKKKDLEGFSNYPVVPEVKENGVNDYSSSNQTTDKFFKNPVSQEKVSKETHKQLSLTGEPINKGDFKHNNNLDTQVGDWAVCTYVWICGGCLGGSVGCWS